ncbi:unnamed protein product [Nesidiocoris tenuis]|uniref:Uncharacterized protein n=1 Tax=Nesidiocoris tenuis TaxID=355587 RepID=A0A6H5HID1_9HEMI|nr:unnamed protein product [Nesidiocoris tenuis]
MASGFDVNPPISRLNLDCGRMTNRTSLGGHIFPSHTHVYASRSPVLMASSNCSVILMTSCFLAGTHTSLRLATRLIIPRSHRPVD